MADTNFVVKNGLVVNGSFVANGSAVNAANITATGLTIGTIVANGSTINVGTTTINSTIYSGTANNANNLGGLGAASYVNTATIADYQTTAGLSANVATLTSNNSLYLGGAAAAVYVNTSAGFTIAGIHAHTANVWVGNTGSNVQVSNTTVLISAGNTATINASSMAAGNSTANVVANGAGVFINGAEKYVNATNLSTGTLSDARLGGSVVLTYNPFTITGVYTFSANVVVSNATPRVTMTETDWGTRWIYMDGGQLGFLKSDGNWAAYTDNSGNLVAAGNVTAYSDVRLKVNIGTIQGAIDKVKRLRGVDFTWKESGAKGIGVVAQEVQDVLPEVVMEGADGTLSVAYGNMVGLLIEAVKELTARVEQLERDR